MNGWTAAAFLLGFMAGIVYGVRSERGRAVQLVKNARVRLLKLAENFANSLPQAQASVFKKTAENIINLDDHRPPKKKRPF